MVRRLAARLRMPLQINVFFFSAWPPFSHLTQPSSPHPAQVHRCVMNVASDFYSGVQAALITRSGSPAWVPASLKDVSEAATI